jgi:hypothetical protein
MNPVEQEPQKTIHTGIGGANTKGSRAKCRWFLEQRSFRPFWFVANLLHGIESLPMTVSVKNNNLARVSHIKAMCMTS